MPCQALPEAQPALRRAGNIIVLRVVSLDAASEVERQGRGEAESVQSGMVIIPA